MYTVAMIRYGSDFIIDGKSVDLPACIVGARPHDIDSGKGATAPFVSRPGSKLGPTPLPP